ncbi:MAG: hypothetical protein WBE86_07205 [Candidatus Acidiferrales bacterium]
MTKSDTLLGVESLKIILLTMAAAILYGVVHDQITIRVCPEYFTVAHPHIFRTSSLTLIALGWGVVATWWGGLAAGVAFALAARAGSPQKFTWRRFVRPGLVLLLVMGASATLAGFIGHWMASAGQISSVQAWGLMLPAEKQPAFMADVFAHVFSYLAGGVGSVIIALAIAWQRFSQRD